METDAALTTTATTVTNQNTNNSSHNITNIDCDKCQKLKRFVIIGLLVTIAVLGWHFYEYFHAKPPPLAPDDILELSKQLYEEELKKNPYIFKVNVQGKTRADAHDDHAPQPLFELHNDLLAMDDNSTTTLMRRLFDNYEINVGIMEQVSPAEEQEEIEFLRAVMSTRTMKLTIRYLIAKKLISADYEAQLGLLKELWFTQYSRGKGIVGSSAFEHVFLAEIRDRTVLGLHNWLYFAEQEQQGHVDYKGWLQRLELAKEPQMVLALRASFHNINKPYNVLLIGTSPELELSLYTVCFLANKNQEPCDIQLGNTRLQITTHSWDWHGKHLIASAYPTI